MSITYSTLVVFYLYQGNIKRPHANTLMKSFVIIQQICSSFLPYIGFFRYLTDSIKFKHANFKFDEYTFITIHPPGNV